MELDVELLSRIRAAASLDKTIKLNDFQVRSGENGSVLINLKTSRAQLVYDDDSSLHDLADLGLSDEGKEENSKLQARLENPFSK